MCRWGVSEDRIAINLDMYLDGFLKKLDINCPAPYRKLIFMKVQELNNEAML